MDKDPVLLKGCMTSETSALIYVPSRGKNVRDVWSGVPQVDPAILHCFWCKLSDLRKICLDRFLKSYTIEELYRLRSRFCMLETEKLFKLLAKLRDATLGQLFSYLRVAASRSTYFEYSTTFRSDGGNISGQDESASCDEAPMHAIALGYQTSLTSDMIYGIPQEIYDTIIKILFRAVYLPGSLIPDQFPVFDGPDCFADVRFCIDLSKTLRRLDHKLYDEYKVKYWTQNTWYIPEGSPTDTMDFLQSIPPEKYLSIRSVSLTFSCRHLNTGSFFSYYDETADLLKNIYEFDEDCRQFTMELQDQWFWKFEILAAMKLEGLILDFRKAFSITGEFLGVSVVRDFHAFTHGLPKLVIEAPSERLRDKIYDVIVAQNTESY